ncbi:hypothetical protein QQ045_015850 [Rhodiola kirilowii]
MAYELHGLLAGNVSIVTGENIKPSYGGDDEAFLRKIITPIYKVIDKEAKKCNDGKAPHSAWCNYDDLNEYFWSSDCFSLGWPMRDDGNFFKTTRDMIQLMVIIAWKDKPVTELIQQKEGLLALSTVFLTASFLRVLQSFLDIFLNFPGYHRWQFTDVLRNILKIISSIAWAVILILCYFSSFPVSIPAQLKDFLSFLPQAKKMPALYLMAIAIYIIPNIVAAPLFIFPMLRRWIENSDWHVIRFLLWWSQIKPLVKPTKDIMNIKQDHEETVYSRSDLESENEDGISTIFYLQKIFPDEWKNFLERLNCKTYSEVWQSDENILQLRHWVSLRGQTLCRTVRGLMYYRRALKLQAFLDIANEEEISKGYKAITEPTEDDKKSQRSTNPSLRVAYIDEVEERESSSKSQKVYYSVLVKAVDNLDQEIYRIKLPGAAKIGEGKPENQNHAIIFTRGEALQVIDMNQCVFFGLVYVKPRNKLCDHWPKSTCKALEVKIFYP